MLCKIFFVSSQQIYDSRMDFEQNSEPGTRNSSESNIKPEQKKTTKELWIELGRLILILSVTIIKYCLSSIGKAILYIWAFIKAGFRTIGIWWRDKDTQEKVHSIHLKIIRFLRLTLKWTIKSLITLWGWIKKGLRIGIRKTIKYILLTFIYLWKGTRWTVINFTEFIIHMRPTVIRMGVAFRQWRQNIARGRHLRKIRKQRRHEDFLRNGGVRGALERKTKSLKTSIRSYMEEEQNEVTPEAITDDEIFREKFEQIENDNKAHVISKKFFKSIKNIVEDNH